MLSRVLRESSFFLEMSIDLDLRQEVLVEKYFV